MVVSSVRAISLHLIMARRLSSFHALSGKPPRFWESTRLLPASSLPASSSKTFGLMADDPEARDSLKFENPELVACTAGGEVGKASASGVACTVLFCRAGSFRLLETASSPRSWFPSGVMIHQ